MLSIVNLSKNIDKTHPLFANVNIQLPVHKNGYLNANGVTERLVIRGSSGSGKTTLLRCISSLDSHDSGSITLDGKTPEEIGIPQWRSNICYVPQHMPRLPGTPHDYLRTIKSLKAQKAKYELDPVEIAYR